MHSENCSARRCPCEEALLKKNFELCEFVMKTKKCAGLDLDTHWKITKKNINTFD